MQTESYIFSLLVVYYTYMLILNSYIRITKTLHLCYKFQITDLVKKPPTEVGGAGVINNGVYRMSSICLY